MSFCSACGGEIKAILSSRRKYCLACSADKDRREIFLAAKLTRERYLSESEYKGVRREAKSL